MTDRKREPLPEGYQFGDALKLTRTYDHDFTSVRVGDAVRVRIPYQWRAPHLNAAEQLKRTRPLNALDNLRSYSTFAASLDGGMTANDDKPKHWNTIEDHEL